MAGSGGFSTAFTRRIAIGVFGTTAGVGFGVKGVNSTNGSNGFLGGVDPKFQQHAGVYGESDSRA